MHFRANTRIFVYPVSMLTQERKSHLLAILDRDGKIEAKAVAKALGLSDDTIRRDLRELAAAGKLQRVHGGALPTSPADADLSTRKGIASVSKQAIGKAAAGLIKPGQLVMLDGGTTALQIVAHLPQDMKLTVVTHSPTIAVALEALTSVRVVMIGGNLFRHSMVCVGAAAIDAMSHIRADIYFMGVTGIDTDAGLSTGDLEEAHIKKSLSQRAADTIVLASSEKLLVASQYIITPLGDVSGVIVDSDTPPSFTQQLRSQGLDVHIAELASNSKFQTC